MPQEDIDAVFLGGVEKIRQWHPLHAQHTNKIHYQSPEIEPHHAHTGYKSRERMMESCTRRFPEIAKAIATKMSSTSPEV